MKDTLDRERLAEASFRKHAANHKGRPHFHAHQCRQASAKKLRAAKDAELERVKYWRQFKDRVRAYWTGGADTHP